MFNSTTFLSFASKKTLTLSHAKLSVHLSLFLININRSLSLSHTNHASSLHSLTPCCILVLITSFLLFAPCLIPSMSLLLFDNDESKGWNWLNLVCFSSFCFFSCLLIQIMSLFHDFDVGILIWHAILYSSVERFQVFWFRDYLIKKIINILDNTIFFLIILD